MMPSLNSGSVSTHVNAWVGTAPIFFSRMSVFGIFLEELESFGSREFAEEWEDSDSGVMLTDFAFSSNVAMVWGLELLLFYVVLAISFYTGLAKIPTHFLLFIL
jgi:hypothetical protein